MKKIEKVDLMLKIYLHKARQKNIRLENYFFQKQKALNLDFQPLLQML